MIRQSIQTGTRIGAIDGRSIGATLAALVTKITVITGLRIDPSISNEFVLEFTKFMQAHYSNLTLDEVSTAFHLNAMESGEEKVKLYGQNLTLELLGQVLTAYKSKRARLMQKINSQTAPAIEAPKPSDKEMISNRIVFVNQFYDMYLNEELKEVSMMYADQVYDDIKRMKPELLPSADIRKKFYEEAKEHRKNELLIPNKSMVQRNEARELVKDYLEGTISYTEEQKIINEGKRRTLLYMFTEFSKQGLKKVL